MRKFLLVLMVFVGLVGAGQRGLAWDYIPKGPTPQTAAFPAMCPPGWYTNTYYYAWQYPWFANYNYSHGPYANWMAGGGFASYANLGPYPMTHGVWTPPPVDRGTPCGGTAGAGGSGGTGGSGSGTCAQGTVTVNLPADAKLSFNGTPATGTGAVRTFSTPALERGTDYAYELTAEVVRDGKTERVTERVVVRAGEKATVTLDPRPGVVTAVGAR
ncbi:TIGR03000 domain-containing protein [Gemmata sp.]|uniref:TIGR03000 domain-containing protein n=1 Tax=Gemmata sp. TaxID=1914242 RepID=UPI003F720E57